jgi:flagellar basal body rod protein FlgG
VVQELVTMIQTQRAYEMNSKAIQTSDQMLQKLGPAVMMKPAATHMPCAKPH